MACVPTGSESSRSRLRNMVTLRLSGLDICESTLRLLQRHMPQLERLDLAHCRDITDSSVALLAAAGTHTRNNLTELTLAGGCVALTPAEHVTAVFSGSSSCYCFNNPDSIQQNAMIYNLQQENKHVHQGPTIPFVWETCQKCH